MGVLYKIIKAGFDVTLVDGFIEISPANQLTEQQLTFLKLHKAEIVSELQAEATTKMATLPIRIFVCCGKCLYFKSHNLHGKGSGRCLMNGDYGGWSESLHQCGKFDACAELVDLTEPKRGLLTVISYTPKGKPIEVVARDIEHATWLKRMNPKRGESK